MTSTVTYPIPGLPTTHLAEDGTRITFRALAPDDQEALLALFRILPEQERRYLKDDVAAPDVVGQWVRGMDYSRVTPLVAEHDGRIVAEATLHHHRAAARRHVGTLRIVVDPAYRDKGIGRGLLHKLAEVARDADMERLLFEVVADVEEAAGHAAMILGFVPVAVLPGHVRDADGATHDLVLMEMSLTQQFPPLPGKF